MSDKFLCDCCGYQFDIEFCRIVNVQHDDVPTTVKTGDTWVTISNTNWIVYKLCRNCQRLMVKSFSFHEQNELRLANGN